MFGVHLLPPFSVPQKGQYWWMISLPWWQWAQASRNCWWQWGQTIESIPIDRWQLGQTTSSNPSARSFGSNSTWIDQINTASMTNNNSTIVIPFKYVTLRVSLFHIVIQNFLRRLFFVATPAHVLIVQRWTIKPFLLYQVLSLSWFMPMSEGLDRRSENLGYQFFDLNLSR